MRKKAIEKSHQFWPFGLTLFAVLLFLDQYTKYYIIKNLAAGESVKVLPGLMFTFVKNTGANWGSFQGFNTGFIWLTVVAFGLLLFFYDKFETLVEKVCYTLILAGLWGNLLDRGVHGYVIDFINLGWWPVFNIADSCISVAVVLFIIEQWRKSRSVKRNSFSV
jgi:signal peptidase II